MQNMKETPKLSLNSYSNDDKGLLLTSLTFGNSFKIIHLCVLAYYDNLIIFKKIINYPINHLLVTLVFGIDGKYITSTF